MPKDTEHCQTSEDPHCPDPPPSQRSAPTPPVSVVTAEPASHSSLHSHPYTLEFSSAHFATDIKRLMYI